jgi:hypothetical protein
MVWHCDLLFALFRMHGQDIQQELRRRSKCTTTDVELDTIEDRQRRGPVTHARYGEIGLHCAPPAAMTVCIFSWLLCIYQRMPHIMQLDQRSLSAADQQLTRAPDTTLLMTINNDST